MGRHISLVPQSFAAAIALDDDLIFRKMEIGTKAPEILGKDQDGKVVALSDFAGKKLALYFYPKDNTPGCTSEACSIRDNYASLCEQGYAVVGVSTDSAASHQRFIAKYELPFPLIADTEKALATTFGVWGEKKMCGRTYMGMLRTTFIVNEEGIVEHIFTPKQIKVKEHASQILAL